MYFAILVYFDFGYVCFNYEMKIFRNGALEKAPFSLFSKIVGELNLSYMCNFDRNDINPTSDVQGNGKRIL